MFLTDIRRGRTTEGGGAGAAERSTGPSYREWVADIARRQVRCEDALGPDPSVRHHAPRRDLCSLQPGHRRSSLGTQKSSSRPRLEAFARRAKRDRRGENGRTQQDAGPDSAGGRGAACRVGAVYGNAMGAGVAPSAHGPRLAPPYVVPSSVGRGPSAALHGPAAQRSGAGSAAAAS